MTNSEETNKIYDNIIQIMNKTKEENSTFLSEKNKKINQKLSLIEKTLFKKNEEIKKVYAEIKQENEKNIIFLNLKIFMKMKLKNLLIKKIKLMK